jgi:predicted RNase H-like HicB family nuclease
MLKISDRYSYLLFYSSDDKAFVAACLEFPELAVQGDTLEEALERIKEAVKARVGSDALS